VGSFAQHASIGIISGITISAISFQFSQLHIIDSIACGALCALSNFTPDLDSPHSKPASTIKDIISTCITSYIIYVLPHIEFSVYIVIAISSFFLLQYIFSFILSRITVHRGMFHSIPAILIWSCIIYNACYSSSELNKIYLTCSAAIGYLLHLITDELYGLIDISGGAFYPKKSSGTALKFISTSFWGTILCYTILICLLWFTF
jgi:LexA-binding, inner membrane-associated putative hydrolase